MTPRQVRAENPDLGLRDTNPIQRELPNLP